MLPLGLLPVVDGGQGLDGSAPQVNLLQGLVVPVHDHLPGAGLVGLVRHHGHKFRLIQVSGDPHILALADIDAGAHNKAGIFPQNRLFHRVFSFSVIFYHCTKILCVRQQSTAP